MDENKYITGLKGEGIFRDLLKLKKHKFAQIDILSISEDDVIYIWEIKHQERFEAPPFDGHGLPPYQLEMRIKIAERTNTIPMFAIIEPEDENGDMWAFIQDMRKLDALPDDRKFITKTGKRIIFHIDEFNKMNVKDFLP